MKIMIYSSGGKSYSVSAQCTFDFKTNTKETREIRAGDVYANMTLE